MLVSQLQINSLKPQGRIVKIIYLEHKIIQLYHLHSSINMHVLKHHMKSNSTCAAAFPS